MLRKKSLGPAVDEVELHPCISASVTPYSSRYILQRQSEHRTSNFKLFWKFLDFLSGFINSCGSYRNI